MKFSMKKYKKNILPPGSQEITYANRKISVLVNPKVLFIEGYRICRFLLQTSYIEKQ